MINGQQKIVSWFLFMQHRNGVKSYMLFMKGMKNAHSFFSLLTSKRLKPN